MSDPLIRSLFLAHLAATLFMMGLIWFVQVVHYPLFSSTGQSEFAAYERRHTRLTTWVVIPPMFLEGVTGLLLCWLRPAGIPIGALWVGMALAGMLWLSTALIQVPCHALLCRGFDAAAHRRLVRSNWVRTIGWSLRGLLALWIGWSALA